MIVKHIPARPGERNATVERARHARNLIDYLRQPEKQSAEKDYQVAYMLREGLGDATGERLFHIGARNFVTKTIVGQRAEMIAVAQMASRSPNPIDHWLLSWREAELPTPAQIDETVAMFVDHLGVPDQPCIYACHGDTDNRHVHLALNRYNPRSKRMIEINDGFTHEAAHQAVALIVARFGWQAEADARYVVVDGRLMMSAAAAARQKEGDKPLNAQAAAFENRTGYRSAQRIAQEEAVPRIKAARSWGDLHAALAQIGILYDKVGTNGVTLTVGDEVVKASSVNGAITRTQVEKRLGPFEPRGAEVAKISRNFVDDRLAGAFRADEYRVERERWHQRRQTRRGNDTSPACLANEDRKQAKLAERNHQAQQRRPPPNLESFYYHRGEVAFIRRWRYRRTVEPLPCFSGVDSLMSNLRSGIDGYQRFACSDGIRYARGLAEPTAFIDRGTKIEVVMQDEQAMLAALRLAVLKFDGKVSINGDAEFRERAFELAQRHGLGHALKDVDLAARWLSLQSSAVPIGSTGSIIVPTSATPISRDGGPSSTNPAVIVSSPPSVVSHEKLTGSPKSRPRQHTDVPGERPEAVAGLAKPIDSGKNPRVDSQPYVPLAPPPTGTTSALPPTRPTDLAREVARARGKNTVGRSTASPAATAAVGLNTGGKVPLSSPLQHEGSALAREVSNSEVHERTPHQHRDVIVPADTAGNASIRQLGSSTSVEALNSPSPGHDERSNQAKQRRRSKLEINPVEDLETGELGTRNSHLPNKQPDGVGHVGALALQAARLAKTAGGVTSTGPNIVEQPSPTTTRKGVER